MGQPSGGALTGLIAAFEQRIAALIADPGQGDQLAAFLPFGDAQKAAFPNIDPHLLDGMEVHINDPDANPLADLVREAFDFDVINNADKGPKLFLEATNVRTGRPKVFRQHDITV